MLSYKLHANWLAEAHEALCHRRRFCLIGSTEKKQRTIRMLTHRLGIRAAWFNYHNDTQELENAQEDQDKHAREDETSGD